VIIDISDSLIRNLTTEVVLGLDGEEDM
jgi:hypothetical protein